MLRQIRPLLVGATIAAIAVALVVTRHNFAAPSAATAPTDSNVSAVAKGSNQFTFDLYAKLAAENDGNLFFSPQSISTALAMTYAGARGETASQMASVLHFDLTPDKLHRAEAALLSYWNALGKQGNVQLSVANRLWGQDGHKFLDAFTKLLRTDYGAELQLVDFAQSGIARQTINAWVEKATSGKIKDLIPEGVLDTGTRLVLTNAVYFKGDWEDAFDKSATKPSDFFLTATEKASDVPLMYQKRMLRFSQTKFADGKELKLLELPYKGKQLSMVVLLPEAKDGLTELEQHLSADVLQQWLDALNYREIKVWLPKFKMTDEFQLSDVLVAMGMKNAFNATADFSGMDGTKQLFISDVVHKAFVDVNEEGTEAAAATGTLMRVKSVAPTTQPEFRADHPFAFVIRDNTTGAILFMGRVVDPR
jgi:serpin B